MSKLDNLGRIVIPITIRRQLQLDTDTEMNFTAVNGSVLITPREKSCKLCGKKIDENSKIELCRACIESVKRLQTY